MYKPSESIYPSWLRSTQFGIIFLNLQTTVLWVCAYGSLSFRTSAKLETFCCDQPLFSAANWKHFCSSLYMKQTDDCFVMCPWSPSRRHNTNHSATVTVWEFVVHCTSWLLTICLRHFNNAPHLVINYDATCCKQNSTHIFWDRTKRCKYIHEHASSVEWFDHVPASPKHKTCRIHSRLICQINTCTTASWPFSRLHGSAAQHS